MVDQSNVKDGESRATPRRHPAGIFCLVCALIVGVVAWFADTSAPLEKVYASTAESNYALLVQGFRAGRLSLNKEPPPELAKLADPYDPGMNGPYLGTVNDLSYYRGRLYLYYGVTPALVFFWPYYALTGHYPSDKMAIVVFTAIGFGAIAGIMQGLRCRYFPDTSRWITTAGTILPGLALALISAANIHEIAITCAFGLSMLALATLWVSLHRPENRLLWLAVASFLYGLAIGSRPTLLFAAAILLFPVFQVCVESGKIVSPRTVALLFAATGPIALVGLGLALYNVLRFNNPFEFGWHYELTPAYRSTSARPFSLDYLWLNARLYFLEPPVWSGYFPYLKMPPQPPVPPGYDVGNAYTGGGIFFVYPVVIFALGAALICRRKPRGTVSALNWFAAACLVFFLAGAVTLCLFFASSNNYELDFLPGLLLMALIGTYCVDRAALLFPVRRRLICLGWFLLMTCSIALNLLGNVEARAGNYFLIGNDYLAAGQMDAAKAQYEKAFVLNPQSGAAYGGLGNVYFHEGRLDEAIVNYQKALKIDPDFVEFQNNLGYCFRLKGRLDDAIAHFKKAVELRPQSIAYRNALGNSYSKKGDWNPAIAEFEQSIKIEPVQAEARNNLAFCLLQIGRIDDAIGQDRIAVNLEPGSATIWANLANALYQRGLFDQAIPEYQKALAIEPDAPDIHERFGDALFQRGEWESAIAQYQAVIKLQPAFAQAHNNLGFCLALQGREDEAIAQYQRAIELDPGFGQAYNNLGNVYRQKRMAAQARNSYEKAIAIAPEFLPAQLNLAWMLATWPDPPIRDGDKAVVLATRLNDISRGNDPRILRTLAAAYAETGRFAEASSTAKQALAECQTTLTNGLQTEEILYLHHYPAHSMGSP